MSAFTVKPDPRSLVHWGLRSRTNSIACAVSITRLILILLLAFGIATGVQAQTINVRIAVASTSPAGIRINTGFATPTEIISFPNAYGSALGLGERIENIVGRDASGRTIVVRKLAPGEFQFAEKIEQLSYEVNLSEAMPPGQHSHVSSLTPERGILMLSDLLPRSMKGPSAFSAALIQLDLPAGWTAESNTQKQTSGTYFSDEPDKAVFLMGPQLQRKAQRIGGREFTVVLSGAWPLANKDVLEGAGRIVQEYSKLTGFELKRDPVLMLAPFPVAAPPTRWTAETRGNAIVLLLGNQGKSSQTKSRLGIALAHEVFHLWVPNSLKLEGDYDWFFEGFTIYQALLMDLRLHLISFKDYLETLAGVYDSYLSAPDRDKLSLLEASERRWSTSSTLVYDKAMLVAFLCDLELRRVSGCNSSIGDVYRGLLVSRSGHEDGNKLIIALLSDRPGLRPYVANYVEGTDPIDLAVSLKGYGLRVSRTSAGTQLTVDKPTKEQARILKCLVKN
jgi:predicted metalloprotease with PDZ domain